MRILITHYTLHYKNLFWDKSSLENRMNNCQIEIVWWDSLFFCETSKVNYPWNVPTNPSYIQCIAAAEKAHQKIWVIVSVLTNKMYFSWTPRNKGLSTWGKQEKVSKNGQNWAWTGKIFSSIENQWPNNLPLLFQNNSLSHRFYAAEAGHSEIVRFLLAQGADPTLQGLDTTGQRMVFPLKLAEQNGHAECAKLIIAALEISAVF